MATEHPKRSRCAGSLLYVVSLSAAWRTRARVEACKNVRGLAVRVPDVVTTSPLSGPRPQGPASRRVEGCVTACTHGAVCDRVHARRGNISDNEQECDYVFVLSHGGDVHADM